jgi:hypothetical protein
MCSIKIKKLALCDRLVTVPQLPLRQWGWQGPVLDLRRA